MAYRLGGRNSLPYLGVEAPTPPNTVIVKRSPTPTDSSNFNLGTFWLVPLFGSNPEELWVLVNLDGGIATWVQLYPSNAGGASQFIEDVGIANELAGVINVIGGADPSGNTNINTFGSGNTVEIILNETIQWPNTTSGQGEGAIFLGGTRFMHNFGENSTFLGSAAGPSTNDSSDNTGIGSSSLVSITTGEFNSALGSNSGFSLTTGDSNTFLGDLAGTQYTTESNNVSISNIGTPGDSGIIRIGTAGNQVGCYITGIYNATIDTTTAFMVLQDNVDKLGAAQITSTDGSIVITQGPGTINFATSSSAGLDGSSFFAFVNPNEVLPASGASDQQNYVGALQAMNLVYDNFGTFNVGPLVGGAQFVVPVNGYYQFTSTINMSFSASLTNQWFSVIYVNGIGVAVNSSTKTPTLTFNATTTGTLIVNANLLLNMGDIITFGTITNNSSSPAPQYLGLFTIGPLSLNAYQTWIMGTLLRTF